MFEFAYKDLFSFRIKHSFYQSEQCNDFIIVPTPQTHAFMQRADMLCKIRSNGLDVRYNAQRQEVLALVLAEEPSFKLSFACFLKNPLFFNFTELPVEFKGLGLYWHNLKPSPEKQAGDTVYRLTPSVKVASEDLLPYIHNLSQQRYADGRHELLLENLQSKKKTTIQWEGVQAPSLPMMQTGVYEAFADAQKQGHFLNVWTDRAALPFAWLDISLEEGTKPIFKDGKVEAVQYEVCFNARSTFWRYFIFPRYLKDFSQLNITGERDLANVFEFKDKRIVANQEAYCFESKKSFSMAERSSLAFQLLKLQNGGIPRKVLERLPVASYEAIKPSSREKKSIIFSEIFVYV